MKRLLTLLLFASLTIIAQAQVPGTLSYQGILVNSSGEPVADGTHYVQFRFYDALTGGTLKYSSLGAGSGNEVTTYKGLFTFVIGSGSVGNAAIPLDVTNSATYIGGQSIYVEITADLVALSPRVPLTTVPNAIHAHNANVVPASGITGTLSVAQGGTGVGSITGVFIGDGTNAATGVTATGGGQFFRRNIANTGYEFTDLSASNGLTVTNGNLSLGGTLAATTNIASGGFDLTFGGAGRFGISTLTPVNRLDVGGNMAIGNTYAGASAAPVNGLLVQGNVGLGTTTVNNRLDVEGGVAVGATYSGTNTAPTNGAIIEGNVGIGTATVVNKLDVEGGAVIGATYSGASTSPTNGLLVEGVVGIGTTTPTRAILEQYGQVGTTNAIFGGGSTGISLMNAFPGIGFNWYQNAGSKAIAAGFGGYLYLDHALGDFNFVTSAATAASANATHTGTTRLTLKNNGRLGIGTTAPANLLDIEGGIAIGTTYSGTTAAPSNGAIIEGNVGIGTNAPALKLDVNGSTVLRGYTGINRTTAITANSFLDVQGTAAASTYAGMYTNGTDAESLPFYGYATAGTARAYHYLAGTTGGWRLNVNAADRLAVTTAGNLGIGVTTPVNKLDVEGAVVIGASYSGTSTAPTNGLLVEGNVGVGTTGSPSVRIYSATPNTNTTVPYGLYVDNAYSGTGTKYGASINVSTDGDGIKYGIDCNVQGLAADASTIYGLETDVTPNGTGTAYGVNSSVGSVGTGARYGVYSFVGQAATNASNVFGFYSSITDSGTGDSYGMYTTGEDANYFDGKVGVNAVPSSTTAADLWVRQSVDFEGIKLTAADGGSYWDLAIGNSADNLHFRFNGGTTAYIDDADGSYQSSSDIRLKENIEEFDFILPKILELNPKTYNFKRDSLKRRSIGLIAQEVLPLFPESVRLESDGYYSMSYSDMGVISIQGIKELHQLIDDQKNQVEQLQSEVSALKQQLSQYQSLSAQVEELKKLVTQTTSANTTATGGNKK